MTAEQVVQDVVKRLAKIDQIEMKLGELTPLVNRAGNQRVAYTIREQYGNLMTEYERLSGKRYENNQNKLNYSGGNK